MFAIRRTRRVRVVNVTRGAGLAERATVADTFWRRSQGLLGKSALAAGEGLLIVPCQSVHSVGMAFPIDVLHLDKHNRVVRVVSDLRPYRLGPFVWRAHSVIELPAGAAEDTVARDDLEIVDLVESCQHVPSSRALR